MDTLRGHGIEPRRVPVNRGDAILWRSDCAHCGATPLGKCDTSRVVVYICCLPAVLTPEPVYEQKLRAYERLETGCHYPNREEWFEETERHKKFPWRKYFTQPPTLTLRQRQLYGLERYGALEPSQVPSASNSSRPMPHSDGNATAGSTKSGFVAVPGLGLAQVSAKSARDTLMEIRNHFKRNGGKSSSDMFEVGWSFHSLERENRMETKHPLAEFPCLRNLILEAMGLMCGSVTSIEEETLNIICRRYTRGQGLPKHIDRPTLFDEDVYGCILLNTSDRTLFLEPISASGGKRISLEEQPGTCYRQREKARYEWLHGVEELQHGERISITWRWIQQSMVDDAEQDTQPRPRSKGKSKGKGKTRSEGNLHEEHANGGRGDHFAESKTQGKGKGGSANIAIEPIPACEKRSNDDNPPALGSQHPSQESKKERRWGRK